MEPKQAAAERALELVEDGMVLGLGTGSTASFFVQGLGRRVAEGLKVTAVATSKAIAEQAGNLGIRLLTSTERQLDLTVDGADEIDPHLNLIKGLGGALIREKVVAAASKRMVVIATGEKLVSELGQGPLPVEVLPLLWERTAAGLEALDLVPALRHNPTKRAAYVTDNGNFILDCRFVPGRDVGRLAADLDRIPGVLGHGLFIDLASQAIVADGREVKVLEPAPV
jgi:ribose 5-phosphate isomerase A